MTIRYSFFISSREALPGGPALACGVLGRRTKPTERRKSSEHLLITDLNRVRSETNIAEGFWEYCRLIRDGILLADSYLVLLNLRLIHQFSVIGNALGAGSIFLLPLRMVFFYQFNKIFIGFHMHQCLVFMHHPTADLTFIFLLFHRLTRTRMR